ncbi:MAG: hypothetical protein JNL01_04815 [Bdellovibrionales bacterium]|nr:hypothetical protein [Bdellovibrionales bacterium]
MHSVADSGFAKRLIELKKREDELRQNALGPNQNWDGDLKAWKAHQEEAAQEMDAYLSKWGWPGFLSVGFEGAQAAGGLISSLWSRPDFMRKCLPLIEQSYRFGDIWGDWFARLYDTVMFFEGKPQVYGTFLHWNPAGKLVPWTLVDPEKVDARRGAMELETLASYVERREREVQHLGWAPPWDWRESAWTRLQVLTGESP